MWQVGMSLIHTQSFTDTLPEMQVNEMHDLCDKRNKLFSFLESHQNKHNSVKYEVLENAC